MTKSQFLREGEEISRQAQVTKTMHPYFVQAVPRLHLSCERFGLFEGELGDVLELGPFYGYIPFILRKQASSYTVLEGNDPTLSPLMALYEKAGIAFSYIDFFDLFGPIRNAPHRLPFPDASFDKILCWETMEHFNFNPVKFVRELQRVLKPGGQAYVTVPNKASCQALFSLVFGRGEQNLIDAYFKYEDYESDGKNVFYGFHWREYTPRSLPVSLHCPDLKFPIPEHSRPSTILEKSALSSRRPGR